MEATNGVRIWQTSLFGRECSVVAGEDADWTCFCWLWVRWQRGSSDSDQTAMLHNL